MSAPTQTGMGMPASAADEASGLKKVMWFGIIQLVGLVGGWVGGFYVFSTIFMNVNLYSSLPANATPSQVATVLGPLFQAVVYIIPLSLGITIAGLIVLYLGFGDLAKVDKPNFSTPRTLTVLLILGLVFVGAGAIPLINSIPNLISQAPTTGTPSSAFMSQLSSLFAYFGIMALGGILCLIGIIGGEILGLWRAGTRYNQTTLKVGAIFEVIPLLNIVAPILIVLGANDAKNTVSK